MDDDQKSPALGPREPESTTGSDSWAEYRKRVHAGPSLPPAALDEAARERVEDPEGVDIAEGIYKYGTSPSMTPADARALSDRMLEELLLRHVDPDLAAVLRAEARRRSDGLPDWFMEETT